MLAVIRHLARGPEQRIGSLFFNPGGPGDSGVAAVAERGEALDALTAGRFDIVGWDIRGSAGSSPVLCFADASERASFWQGLPVPTTRTEQRRYLAKTVALAQRCGARNDGLLAHITPPTPLGTSTTCVGWWGTGSSTIWGSPTAPSSARPTPTCSRAGSGPWCWEALTALKYSGLPDPALWPEVAAVFELAAEGDASVLDAIAAGATSDQARVLLQEQGVALVCADSPARHPATAWPGVVRRLAAVSRIGGPPLGWINAPCASWPTSSADRYTGPWNATTKHPILVIGTRFDPNTPLANARHAARRLGNAVLLTHDGYGHLSRRDPSTCVVQATGRYLMDLTTPAPGTVCPSDRLPFDPEFGQPRS